ncbi:hypothetical protein KJ605_00740 [Patescibacteria group bacterium]|nr:hypothetical protein [Patescibacteria group bacterium]MBU1970293.1 hypothetical protein [Patescibacteria group bacterium]
MQLIARNTVLWNYLSCEQKGLVEDGELLIEQAHKMPRGVSDFSYLVFPFSKAYEGFLKKLFLDMRLMRPEDYYGEDIRIGKILNPHFTKEHGSVYNRVCKSGVSNGENLVAAKLWETWKKGRNLVFHYFPHNFRRLSYDEAKQLIEDIIYAMNFAMEKCELPVFQAESVSSLVAS